MRTARTTTPLLPPTAIGLDPSDARRRYRLHTLLMLGLFLLSWTLYLRINLSDMAETIRLARAPQYTATIQAPDQSTGLPVFFWIDRYGAYRYGLGDDEDHYRPGDKVPVREYWTPGCWTWETGEDRSDDVIGMMVCLFLIPAGAAAGYLFHRHGRWTGLMAASRSPAISGQVTGTFRFGHRTLLSVDLQGRTVHVPLMRDQLVAALTSLSALKPVRGGGRFVAFRLVSAGRTVWPSGPYRTRLLPVGAIVGRVLWVCGPPMLTLAVHLFRAPIAPC
jgi:hypothetical protein